MKLLSHILFSVIFCFSVFAQAETAKVLEEKKDTLPFKIPKNLRSLPETARIETTKGFFVIKFYRREAPISVANFAHLANKGFYDGVSFHRLVPGFMIQGGDPTGTAKGGPGWTLPPELGGRARHNKGALGWARLHAKVNPLRRSNGSQFYITLRDAPDLDGFYTVFAQVVRGYKTVELLRKGDRILNIDFSRRKKKANKSSTKEDSFAINQESRINGN